MPLSLAPPEGPMGSQVPGQQDPGPPVTPGLEAWCAGGPGAFSLMILEGRPPGLLKPSGYGGRGRRQLVVFNCNCNLR